ncbi:hypothetical protein LTS08_000329 [Lithohypha guttulata]|nr:hypothetical protein LTS08_000329 [Lithohypha guttulata]
MRFYGLIFALLAAITFAQQNVINNPVTGWDVSTGSSVTITWTMPSSGTVSIRLTQGGNIEPGSGDLLISNIPASAGRATVTIPEGVNAAAYNFQIVDDTNSNNVNFSSPFTIAGGSDQGNLRTMNIIGLIYFMYYIVI